jgi:hypothetical protein
LSNSLRAVCSRKEKNIIEAWRYEKSNMLTKAHIRLLSKMEHLMVAGNEAKRILYRIIAPILTTLSVVFHVMKSKRKCTQFNF